MELKMGIQAYPATHGGVGVWCVVCGVWCVVCGVWCVVRGEW